MGRNPMKMTAETNVSSSALSYCSIQATVGRPHSAMVSTKTDRPNKAVAAALETVTSTTTNNSSSSKVGTSTTGTDDGNKVPLSLRYPVNSTWEFTLQPNEEIADGTVYCTDETSQMIVLQKSLAHTTLTFEVRMVQVASIMKEKLVSSSAENDAAGGDTYSSKPLPVVDRKVLEEREKRALRLAEESFRHINQNVSDSPPYLRWYLHPALATESLTACLCHFSIGFCQRTGNLRHATKSMQ